MSWADDTDKILADKLGDVTVTVFNYAPVFTSTSAFPIRSGTSIETSTVFISAKSGAFIKEANGEKIVNTHEMIFPASSLVVAGYRVYESGDTDYHEVLYVYDIEGHKQVYTKKVEGR